MAKNRVVKVKVPASSANLGPGFDCLALALGIYDEYEMALADGISISVKGEGEKDIPKDENNMMVKVVEHLFRHLGKPFSGISIKAKTNIPQAHGLGASSAAIAGGLYCANELLGRPLNRDELFNMASHLEGHPDNVAAAFYGGFTLAWKERADAKAVSFPPPANIKIVLGIPNFDVYTIRARNILPAVWPKEDVVFSLSRACLLTAAMATKKYDWIATACQDKLHEPYRGQLIPGYDEIRSQLLKDGALAAVISGSGPTILAFANKNVDKIRKTMVDGFKKHKVKSTALLVKPSPFGVR